VRIGVIGLLHESNTFIHEPTTLRRFEENTLLCGESIRAAFSTSFHEIGGFFQGAARAGLEVVPIFVARAMPYGAITAETFETLCDRMLRELTSAGKLDGLLVAPHGATVSESFPDADGEWLTRVRYAVGSAMPIVGTLDPHANLSPAMVAACNALIAYRTNPHLDQQARGEEAAELLGRTLRGEVRPVMAASYPPVAMNIERQCTAESPSRELLAEADRWRREPGVLTNSVLLGFPYADVAEMGSAFITVTNNDLALAQRGSAALAGWLWEHRREFAGEFITIEDAVSEAVRGPGPVCLLDMGDNVGGGSPGDGTLLAHALLRHAGVRSFVCLFDPEAVQTASKAGVGATLSLELGGKVDPLHGPPLRGEFTVERLADGRFEEPQPRHGGYTQCDQGPTAVLSTKGGMTVMLTSLRMPPFSLRQLTAFGVEPREYQVLVAKGVNAPVAAYAPVCARRIRVNTPGVTVADMRQLSFSHRRRPLFPFETDFEWSVS